MEIHKKLHTNIIDLLLSIQALHSFQHPYIQETRKIDT